MKKLIIISILLFATLAFAGAWDPIFWPWRIKLGSSEYVLFTTDNVVFTADKIKFGDS